MIKSIRIKNYRGIKDLEIGNFKKYNFFIGDNGSKKTTILESIGIGVSLLNFEKILLLFNLTCYLPHIFYIFWEKMINYLNHFYFFSKKNINSYNK